MHQPTSDCKTSYLKVNEMLSNPTLHVSRVYDAAMVFKATHPTGEMVQRPAGFKRLERKFRRLRLYLFQLYLRGDLILGMPCTAL